MSAQPIGLGPEKTEMWVAEQSWGDFRMYWTEKQARRNASAPSKWIDGAWKSERPARIFKVSLLWEEV